MVEVSIVADCDDLSLLKVSELAFGAIKSVQQVMSFHDTQSELSQINQVAYLKPVQVSEAMYLVLKFAQDLHYHSGGVFDVSVAPCLIRDGLLPSNHMPSDFSMDLSVMVLSNNTVFFQKPLLLDLGGIAKGYAVDLALQCIEYELSGSLQQASVNAGGDLKVYNWENYSTLVPDTNKSMHQLTMRNAAIATSSSYYLDGNSAIYDTTQGQAIEMPQTVSVFSDRCMIADALTKVAAQVGSSHPVFDHFEAEVFLL